MAPSSQREEEMEEGEEGGVDAYFAMLRWTKMSPGLAAVTTDSGTRESAQPIQSTCKNGRTCQRLDSSLWQAHGVMAGTRRRGELDRMRGGRERWRGREIAI